MRLCAVGGIHALFLNRSHPGFAIIRTLQTIEGTS
jgi:hypothetical protein